MPRELNRPTPEGMLLGEELARLANNAEAERIQHFPGMKLRCGTCAFRKGTIPNGCVETLMDAIKCVGEFRDFMCHETMKNGICQEPCQGWLLMCSVSKGRFVVPWKYTEEYAEEEKGASR